MKDFENLQRFEATFLDDETNPPASEALIHFLGVACDLTASYHKGAHRGPKAILEASWQVEYEVPVLGSSLSAILPIHHLGILDYSRLPPKTSIKKAMERMVRQVKELSLPALKQKRFFMLTGGDHSVPNGVFQALQECYSPKEITVIHFDAHLDLRKALGGFRYSHGSIMRRVREAGFPVIHIGIRDHLGEEEWKFLQKENLWEHIFFCATQPKAFYQAVSSRFPMERIFQGEITEPHLQKILHQCNTPYVWISCDIDGLDPKDMPGTGTPLPHGLSLSSVENFLFHLIQSLKRNNQKLLGIDLNEVSPQMFCSPEEPYQIEKVISTQTEQNAALLLYKVLFWNFLEKFTL
ncbi:MAG: arginase family protein [Planctomycetota bacterium]